MYLVRLSPKFHPLIWADVDLEKPQWYSLWYFVTEPHHLVGLRPIKFASLAVAERFLRESDDPELSQHDDMWPIRKIISKAEVEQLKVEVALQL